MLCKCNKLCIFVQQNPRSSFHLEQSSIHHALHPHPSSFQFLRSVHTTRKNTSETFDFVVVIPLTRFSTPYLYQHQATKRTEIEHFPNFFTLQLSNFSNSSPSFRSIPRQRQPNQEKNLQQIQSEKNKNIGLLLAAIVILGVGFSYAFVPLYRLFCGVTGMLNTL